MTAIPDKRQAAEGGVRSLRYSELSHASKGGFAPVPGYLDTAAVGLPPQASLSALRKRITEWEEGVCEPQSFDPDVRRARAAFAEIAGVGEASVGIVSQVSVVAGMVASSLPDGATVVCAEEDFTSVLFPFLADNRLDVITVPLARLLEVVDSDVDLVALSAVQSSSGVVADLDRLEELSTRHRFRTFVDVTQAAGWLPLEASRFDVTACHGYKWLCSPRGAAFLTVGRSALDWLEPMNAGWYAGSEPWSSIYGPPLRLAENARRFDVSPAWFSYVAAAPGLELLADYGVNSLGEHSVGLANYFRQMVGLPESNSAIVSLESEKAQDLADAGIVVSARAGRMRLSFFIYNDSDDAENAARIVGSVS